MSDLRTSDATSADGGVDVLRVGPSVGPVSGAGTAAGAAHEPRSPHRTYPVTATPRDAAFSLTFVVAFVVALLAIAALNAIVDPIGMLGTGIVPRAIWDDRDVKADVFLRQRPRPELLIVGSSRTMKMDPRCATALTGSPAFNFGVSAGRPEDDLAILRFVADSAPGTVRRVVLGMEPDVLLDDFELGFFARQSRYLRAYAPAGHLSPNDLTRALWSQEVTSASVASLLQRVRPRGAPATNIAPNGFLTYVQDEDAMRRGTFDQRSRLQDFALRLRPVFGPHSRLDPVRVQLLERMLRESKDRGIRVDVFIPPAHPEIVRDLAATDYPKRLAEVRSLLLGYQRDGLLVYHETASAEALGLDPAGYFDGYHMTAPNAARVLATVLGGGACAVQ